MKLVPLGDRVVLKELKAEETTKSGIVLPGPTAITSASCGFSCAELVRMIPDFVVSSAFNCFNTTLSDNGTNFIVLPPFISVSTHFFRVLISFCK